MGLLYEPGHEWVYRLTALSVELEPLESRYFLTAYQARGWRDELRKTGYLTAVARVAASGVMGFMPIDDDYLDRLAELELDAVPPGPLKMA